MINRYLVISERSFGDSIQHIEEFEGDDFADAKAKVFEVFYRLEYDCPDLSYRVDLEKTETIWRTETKC